MNFQYRELARLKLAMRAEIGFRPSYGAVFEQLLAWENATTGDTCPGQRSLARALGYARETVNRACRWLELHGYIKGRQRFKRMAQGGVRFLSKRYWVAKDAGQVQWMLADFARRACSLLNAGIRHPLPKRFSCDFPASPPSRTELYSAPSVSPHEKRGPDGPS